MPIPQGATKAEIGKTIGHEFKHGTLHSGSPKGPIVTSEAQKRAIIASTERAHGLRIAPPHRVKVAAKLHAQAKGGK